MNADAVVARPSRSGLISPLILEEPGAWRWLAIAGLFLAAIAPALPLLAEALASTGAGAMSGAFAAALRSSLLVAALAAGGAFVLGLPMGVAMALYDFPGRLALIVCLALPILLPPFLIALGWAMLAGAGLDGPTGPIIVFGLWTMPLVAFATYAGGMGLSATAIEAARVAGGERCLIGLAARYTFVPALAAAGLGAALSIADPGPGQVFRMPSAASEILTSFAALGDFGLAARQSALVAAVILVAAGPLAWFVAPRIAQALMARETRRARRLHLRGAPAMAASAAALIAFAALMAPMAGLVSPLAHSLSEGGGPNWFSRAFSEVLRTGGDTLLYAAGAGLIAVLLGFSLSVAVGRSPSRRRFAVAACLFLLCLPPALAALGMIRLATAAPAWTDPVLRSRFVLCLVLGLRLFPVAAFFGLRSWASSPPSWTHAAAVHGVSLPVFFGRVTAPHLLPAASAAALLCGLLAIADIGAALLLHPPGAASLPLAIFTVMANAPEALTASLALLYVGIAAALLLAALSLAGRRR